MLDRGHALSPADLARIATLHVESIDDSLPALLGTAFTEQLYRFLAASEKELVFVERVDGEIASVCVVSFEPDSLQKRIVGKTLVRLLPAALAALFTNAAFREHLRHALREALGAADVPLHAPEITYVFTNPRLRGRQLGRYLVERVDRELSARAVRSYYVKTLDDPDNRALGFYAANGFVRLGTRIEGGRRFVEFQKSLGPR